MKVIDSYLTGTPVQQAAQRIDHRIQVAIMGNFFIAMFMLAFILPEKLQDMIWIMSLIDFSRQWLPNIVLVAGRANQPELVEAYLILGLACTLPTFIAYTVFRPKSNTLVPIGSLLAKILGVTMLALFVVVMSAFWWNPIVSEFKVGALEGRFGAIMGVALAGRLGMATILNSFFCLGPLMFSMFIWMLITKPVRQTVDFTKL